VKEAPVKEIPVKAVAVKAAPAKAAPAKAAPAKAAPAKAAPDTEAVKQAPAKLRVKKAAPEGAAPAIVVGAEPDAAVLAPAPAAPPAPRPARRPPPSVSPAERAADAAVAAVEGQGSAVSSKPGLPPIRPYRGTQSGKPSKKGRQRKRPRDRFSKIFAEFETKPAEPARKKKRRALDDEDEDTSISVLRERPKLQIESPEQIREGVLKKYLETGQPSCPVGCGGIAEVVRVGTLEDGAGEVWIECLSCAQRDRFIIPKASATERQTALHAMEEIGEAQCPRHGRNIQLRRRGRDLVCPDCGVLYPES